MLTLILASSGVLWALFAIRKAVWFIVKIVFATLGAFILSRHAMELLETKNYIHSNKAPKAEPIYRNIDGSVIPKAIPVR